jgi:hypothetical protein
MPSCPTELNCRQSAGDKITSGTSKSVLTNELGNKNGLYSVSYETDLCLVEGGCV